MTDVEIFDSKRDATDWNSLLDRLGRRLQDIYLKPEYGALYCSKNTESKLFAYQEGIVIWVYSFLLRGLPATYREIAGSDARDIETPYGYGGPVTNSEDPAFVERANSAFQKWCNEWGIVAEFVRFHPLLDNQEARRPYIDPLLDRGTVSLGLAGDAPIISRFDGNARNMVRRFEQEGATIEETDLSEDFDRFVEIYKETMHRVSADAFYYFDLDHFDRLRRMTLGPAKLYVVKLDGRITAGAIFLMGGEWMHYHLSATDPDHRVPGATNAVILCAAEIGRTKGLKRLHLGGGNSNAEDDPLFRFKRRMGTDTHDFWIGRRIHNEEVYRAVCNEWRRDNADVAHTYGGRLLCYHYRRNP